MVGKKRKHVAERQEEEDGDESSSRSTQLHKRPKSGCHRRQLQLNHPPLTAGTFLQHFVPFSFLQILHILIYTLYTFIHLMSRCHFAISV